MVVKTPFLTIALQYSHYGCLWVFQVQIFLSRNSTIYLCGQGSGLSRQG